MRRRRTWVIAAVVVVAALIGVPLWVVASNPSSTSGNQGVHTASPSDSPTPTPSSSTGTRKPIALGVDVSANPSVAALRRYVATSGRRPAIVESFASFGEPILYASQTAAVRSVGATLLVSWDPVSTRRQVTLADIAKGDYDSYLRRNARLVAAVGSPVMIRFAHEMNLKQWPWSPRSQHVPDRTFVAAWRHVVTVFRQAGATNARWVWSPNATCLGSCPFDGDYPGNAWVDYVALDGYNYSSTRGEPFESLAELFGSSYDDITALSDKPVLIASTGSVEQGGSKAGWIRQGLLHDVPIRLPRVVGVIYTDRRIEEPWQVTTSRSALKAWRAVVTSPLYAGRQP
jgi:hypothetical protein